MVTYRVKEKKFKSIKTAIDYAEKYVKRTKKGVKIERFYKQDGKWGFVQNVHDLSGVEEAWKNKLKKMR
jgi:hypothetical protein